MDKELPPAGEAQQDAVQMRRVYWAPRERVFRAWVEPEALKQWFHPTSHHTNPEVEVDLREGGRYTIVMQTADGSRHRVGGEYREIRSPVRLAFTWQWQGEDVEPETLVTIDFLELGPDFTEVVLTHTGFGDVNERNGHTIGWEGTLNQLIAFLAEQGEGS